MILASTSEAVPVHLQSEYNLKVVNKLSLVKIHDDDCNQSGTQCKASTNGKDTSRDKSTGKKLNFETIVGLNIASCTNTP